MAELGKLRTELIRKIEEGFKDVRYPGDKAFRPEFRERLVKKHWGDIPASSLPSTD